jgi:hypothetical protein
MLSLLLLAALSADPAPRPQVMLALPGLNAVNLAPGEGDLYGEVISQKFIEHGVKVMTARDLTAVLGLERQKQLMGCAEESCVVEMTAALGADGVLVGDLGKLGTEYALNLKVLASKNGDPIALFNARAQSAHDLDRVIDNSVHAILKTLAVKLNRPELALNTTDTPAVVVASPAPASGPSLRLVAIVPAAVGVVAIGVGAGLQAVAGSKYTELSGGHLAQPDAAALRDSGKGLDTGGTIALIGGGVALAAAVVMFIAGGPSDAPKPVAFVGPNGAGVGIVGVLP